MIMQVLIREKYGNHENIKKSKVLRWMERRFTKLKINRQIAHLLGLLFTLGSTSITSMEIANSGSSLVVKDGNGGAKDSSNFSSTSISIGSKFSLLDFMEVLLQDFFFTIPWYKKVYCNLPAVSFIIISTISQTHTEKCKIQHKKI